MKKILTLCIAIAILFPISCSRIAQNNQELEKIYEHYRNDSLKLKAAEFLIANMGGHYSVDSTLVEDYAPFYDDYVALGTPAKHRDSIAKRGKEIDSLWNKFTGGTFRFGLSRHIYDSKSVTTSYLISEIDLAFKAWKGNIFTRNCSFEEFCEYILPYRRAEGLLLDDARKKYYDMHHMELFCNPEKELLDEVDSLLLY